MATEDGAMGGFFVAGATGYTGQAVVRRACALGVDVVAHIRPDSARLSTLGSAFEELGAVVDTTPWEPGPMTERLQTLSPQAVFSLLGTTQKRGLAARRAGRAPETYETVDEGLTLMLLAAAEQAEPLPRFVYLSSEGAQGAARSPYMRARASCEAALAGSGLPWISARPCFVTGSDRDDFRPMERGGAMLFDGLLWAAGSLGMRRTRKAYRSITSERLAAALVSLALDEQIQSQAISSLGLQERADGAA